MVLAPPPKWPHMGNRVVHIEWRACVCDARNARGRLRRSYRFQRAAIAGIARDARIAFSRRT